MITHTPATPCLSCRERAAYARGLCVRCYERADYQGVREQYPDCGAVPVPYLPQEFPTFEGFPDGYTHAPTGWPAVPALTLPPVPELFPANRWRHVVWFRRPTSDPVGQRLFDKETRYVEQAA